MLNLIPNQKILKLYVTRLSRFEYHPTLGDILLHLINYPHCVLIYYS